MNLYLIHCGYYDEQIYEGIYEFHINIPIAAKNLSEAREKVRLAKVFAEKKMHIDGIQEIKTVSGYRLELISIERNDIQTEIVNHFHRDL